jgi:hypothetical protein
MCPVIASRDYLARYSNRSPTERHSWIWITKVKFMYFLRLTNKTERCAATRRVERDRVGGSWTLGSRMRRSGPAAYASLSSRLQHSEKLPSSTFSSEKNSLKENRYIFFIFLFLHSCDLSNYIYIHRNDYMYLYVGSSINQRREQ